MRTLNVAVSLAVALSAPAAGLTGQAGTGEAERAESFCWRGQSPPACRDFAIFELEWGAAVASTKVAHESSAVTTEYPVFENELKWHLGAMRNVSKEWAVGGTVSLGTGSPSALTGIRFRARRWLAPSASAELEAGVVDTGIIQRFGSGLGWGPTVGARLNMGDQLSVFTRWEGAYAQAGSDEYFRRRAGVHHGLYLGASAGSTMAAIGTGVLGILALLALYSLSQANF